MPRKPPGRSAETGGLQVIIGLNDLPKPIFRTPVAAVGVGMMPLYQGLELSLDIGPFGVGFKAEHVEGAALRIENLAALGRGPRMAGPGGAGLAEQRERVLGGPAGGAGFGPTAPGVTAFAADRAHFPGRTVAGNGLLLIFRDCVLAHAGEKIVRIVVFAHVFEAELPILAGAQPALRRPMGGRCVATRPLAGRKLRAQPAVLVGLDPDAIKEGRVRWHYHDYAGRSMAGSRLDRL